MRIVGKTTTYTLIRFKFLGGDKSSDIITFVKPIMFANLKDIQEGYSFWERKIPSILIILKPYTVSGNYSPFYTRKI